VGVGKEEETLFDRYRFSFFVYGGSARVDKLVLSSDANDRIPGVQYNMS
jgi:hypothetical protein